MRLTNSGESGKDCKGALMFGWHSRTPERKSWWKITLIIRKKVVYCAGEGGRRGWGGVGVISTEIRRTKCQKGGMNTQVVRGVATLKMRDMMLEKWPQNKGDVQGSSAWKYEGQDAGKWPQKQVVQGVISTEMWRRGRHKSGLKTQGQDVRKTGLETWRVQRVIIVEIWRKLWWTYWRHEGLDVRIKISQHHGPSWWRSFLRSSTVKNSRLTLSLP